MQKSGLKGLITHKTHFLPLKNNTAVYLIFIFTNIQHLFQFFNTSMSSFGSWLKNFFKKNTQNTAASKSLTG